MWDCFVSMGNSIVKNIYFKGNDQKSLEKFEKLKSKFRHNFGTILKLQAWQLNFLPCQRWNPNLLSNHWCVWLGLLNMITNWTTWKVSWSTMKISTTYLAMYTNTTHSCHWKWTITTITTNRNFNSVGMWVNF